MFSRKQEEDTNCCFLSMSCFFMTHSNGHNEAEQMSSIFRFSQNSLCSTLQFANRHQSCLLINSKETGTESYGPSDTRTFVKGVYTPLETRVPWLCSSFLEWFIIFFLLPNQLQKIVNMNLCFCQTCHTFNSLY